MMPLFVFNQFDDLERCARRPGNVHSADGWRGVLEPVIARYRGTATRRYFRGDAAFANPGVYAFLEKRRHGLHDPAASQQGLARKDWPAAQAAGWAAGA
jgi:hypothetical protein